MISLCIISRKEDQESLIKAIGSVGRFVDEVIVVDTSRADKLVAKDLNYVSQPTQSATHPVLALPKVIPFEWTNDFAAARNFSFDQATHDVILWLDSDDIVHDPETLPELAQHIESGEVDWIDLEYIYARDEHGNVTMRQWKPRLMRKGTGKWVGRIHESFIADSQVRSVRSNEVVILHEVTESHGADSANRNLAILLDEVETQGEKVDPRTLYYTGMTLMELRRFEEAAPFFIDHIKKCGWAEEKYFSMHYLAHCFAYAGKLEQAINVSLESLKVMPHWSLAYLDLGEFYSQLGEHQKCVEWTHIGMDKQKPNPQDYFVNDLDYSLMPLGRLADAYLQLGHYKMALEIAQKLKNQFPRNEMVDELYKTCVDINKTEDFVISFSKIAQYIRDRDRVKAQKLFDALPIGLDEDIRIQALRAVCVPPKTYENNHIAIYCGKGNGENWAYPSIFTGIGGSEEAVIHMSRELVKQGYQVTVFNNCGSMRGVYDGVEYLPYYYISDKDQYNTVIAWRTPALFDSELKAKKKIVWLHDIAYPHQFNDRIIENTDKFIFLSKWHRNNMPSIPDEKCFISNNGIVLDDFKDVDVSAKEGIFWGSSYDRGLLCLMKDIMPEVNKRMGHDVPVHVCYGWNNIDRELELIPELKTLKAELIPLLDQSFVTHHGRVSHKRVAELLKGSKVMAYASEFGETNMITSQKAQAAQTWVVIPKDAGGAPERVKYGTVIDGEKIYTNKETKEKFIEEVVRALKADVPGDFDASEFSWAETAKSWKAIL